MGKTSSGPFCRALPSFITLNTSVTGSFYPGSSYETAAVWEATERVAGQLFPWLPGWNVYTCYQGNTNFSQ